MQYCIPLHKPFFCSVDGWVNFIVGCPRKQLKIPFKSQRVLYEMQQTAKHLQMIIAAFGLFLSVFWLRDSNGNPFVQQKITHYSIIWFWCS